MQTTKNLGLKKPEPEDFYNVQDQNTNMDIIDEEFGGVLSCVLSTAEPSSNNTLWLYPKNTTTSTSELVLGDAPHKMRKSKPRLKEPAMQYKM